MTIQESFREERNPEKARLFSLIPGLGQQYNGQTLKAIAVLMGTLIGLLIFLLLGGIVWAYGMYDAGQTSRKMNLGEIPYKKTNNIAMIIFGGFAGILVIVFIYLGSHITHFAL